MMQSVQPNSKLAPVQPVYVEPEVEAASLDQSEEGQLSAQLEVFQDERADAVREQLGMIDQLLTEVDASGFVSDNIELAEGAGLKVGDAEVELCARLDQTDALCQKVMGDLKEQIGSMEQMVRNGTASPIQKQQLVYLKQALDIVQEAYDWFSEETTLFREVVKGREHLQGAVQSAKAKLVTGLDAKQSSDTEKAGWSKLVQAEERAYSVIAGKCDKTSKTIAHQLDELKEKIESLNHLSSTPASTDGQLFGDQQTSERAKALWEEVKAILDALSRELNGTSRSCMAQIKGLREVTGAHIARPTSIDPLACVLEVNRGLHALIRSDLGHAANHYGDLGRQLRQITRDEIAFQEEQNRLGDQCRQYSLPKLLLQCGDAGFKVLGAASAFYFGAPVLGMGMILAGAFSLIHTLATGENKGWYNDVADCLTSKPPEAQEIARLFEQAGNLIVFGSTLALIGVGGTDSLKTMGRILTDHSSIDFLMLIELIHGIVTVKQTRLKHQQWVMKDHVESTTQQKEIREALLKSYGEMLSEGLKTDTSVAEVVAQILKAKERSAETAAAA